MVVVLALAVLVSATGWAGGQRIPFDTSEWKTDFTKHSVPFSEIMSGGPPKDGIPAIDTPNFDPVPDADKWVKLREPVILCDHAGKARAYPLQILVWHEIANDTVAGLPVAVTFCPLCNTSIVFDRRLEGRVLHFGTTGKLRFSDLVMYDRQTESWWQQVTGEAIVGELTGKHLTFLASQIISWGMFKLAYAGGKVLNRETGHRRSYGNNPYVGYDDINSSPFLYRGPKDGRLPPMERVVTISLNGEDVAYPFSVMEKVRVVNDTAGGRPIVILRSEEHTSELQSPCNLVCRLLLEKKKKYTVLAALHLNLTYRKRKSSDRLPARHRQHAQQHTTHRGQTRDEHSPQNHPCRHQHRTAPL